MPNQSVHTKEGYMIVYTMEQRDARDRQLAASVGIEIGRMREQKAAVQREHRASMRGFIIGVILASVIVATIFTGISQAKASSAAGWPVAPRAASTQLPPGWRVFLSVCHQEQPRIGSERVSEKKNRGGGWWHNIAWHQTYNHSFLGGCGFRNGENWDRFKRKGQPATMNLATPIEQLWACYRIYSYYARIGGPAYGASVWGASNEIGFVGLTPSGGWR